MRRLAKTATLVAALGFAGCDEADTDTCRVGNDGLSLVAIAVDNGEQVRAEIDIEAGERAGPGAGNPVSLCDKDKLTIAGQEPTLTVKPDRTVYSVTLPADTPRDVSFRIERDSDDTIEMIVPLPPSFSITAPVGEQEVPRSEDLVLTWDPPLAMSEIRLNVQEEVGYGVCVETQPGPHDYKSPVGIPVPDTGTWTIPADNIASMTPDPCRAFYNLRRIQRGPYPETLAAGGFVEGRVERTVEILSVP